MILHALLALVTLTTALAPANVDGIRLLNGRENVLIQPWGEDGFRVRATLSTLPNDDTHSVLLDPPLDGSSKSSPLGTSYSTTINATQNATLTNGYASVSVTENQLSFYRIEKDNKKTLVLQELWPGTPSFPGRWYNKKSFRGGSRSQHTFRAPDSESESLFGTGQDLTGYLNKKNQTIDIVNFNSLNPIPTIMSDRGYLFFWNMPSLGKMELSPDKTRFSSDHTEIVDYYIAIRPQTDYDGLLERYTAVTGRSPTMPDFGTGYWQSKLRYATQEEVLNVTRGFAQREIPLSMLVIDFLSWSHEGDWKLNSSAFPDTSKMAQEVKKLTGSEMMVSVWPSIEDASPNWPALRDLGLVAQTFGPVDIAGLWQGKYVHVLDPTNPEARQFLWDQLKENYYQHGIRNFWLDEDEGGQVANDVYPWTDYSLGAGDQYAMLYPYFQQMGVYEGQLNSSSSTEPTSLTLTRSSWAGSQRFASAVWSGDIFESWESMRQMIVAGQSMSMSGQGWWTLDIGGFKTNGLPNSGNVSDPEYQELYVRWLQWGTFLPIMRNHGDRTCLPSAQEDFVTCPNEPWSYGPENEKIIVSYIKLRYKLQPYIKTLFRQLSHNGRAIIRPLFMDFSVSDPYTITATEALNQQYMFGPRLLVAPVTTYQATNATVYLPNLSSSAPGSKWTDWWSNKTFEGGQWVTVPASKEIIPIFRLGSASDILTGNI